MARSILSLATLRLQIKLRRTRIRISLNAVNPDIYLVQWKG